MRVLGHVHSFNDADIIDRTIEALLQQTHLLDGILVVDNGSTDGTLDRPSLKYATILRHPENRGTSGTVVTGMQFALAHDYDWIWLFDADSIPEPDALEQLLDLYAGWPQSRRDKIGCLACLPYNQFDGQPLHGSRFTRLGRVGVTPSPGQRHHPLHVTIWSGSLYPLSVVRRMGLPNPDYVLDWGEYEYGYRMMKAGYESVIVHDAVIKHNIRGSQSLKPINVKLGPATIRFYEFPAIRCYYMCRNMLYLTLYETAETRFNLLRGAVWRLRGAHRGPGPARGVFWSALLLTMNFVLRPRRHEAQIVACFRGIWHGLTGNIAARY